MRSHLPPARQCNVSLRSKNSHETRINLYSFEAWLPANDPRNERVLKLLQKMQAELHDMGLPTQEGVPHG